MIHQAEMFDSKRSGGRATTTYILQIQEQEQQQYIYLQFLLWQV